MSLCSCNPEEQQVCPECEDGGGGCWRCGGDGWVEAYDPALNALLIHEEACVISQPQLDRSDLDPMEDWTPEDLEHVDDAITWFLDKSTAVGMPGLEWVRDKLAARLDVPLRFHEEQGGAA